MTAFRQVVRQLLRHLQISEKRRIQADSSRTSAERQVAHSTQYILAIDNLWQCTKFDLIGRLRCGLFVLIRLCFLKLFKPVQQTLPAFLNIRALGDGRC